MGALSNFSSTYYICLAPTLDLRYERLYGYLQDDVTRKRLRINLVLDAILDCRTAALGRQ